MKIDITNGQRVGMPTNANNYLYNAECKVITEWIVLGKNADENEWAEITAEEKAIIEASWTVDTEATEQDYQNALAEMGVKFDE